LTLFRGTLLVTTLLLAGRVPAEETPAPTPASPEIHPDRTLTFRLRAPKAETVTVQGNWDTGEPHALEKGAGGLWSATVGPFPPQIYTYSLEVDGLSLPDPGNVRVMSRPGWGKASLLEIPGDRPSPWSERPRVRHGGLATHAYLYRDRVRRCVVYTPPGYETNRGRFPVLYLLHGFGGNEKDWIEAGPAHVVADNLIADGKAVPAIIVMPDAHAVPPVLGDDTYDERNSRVFEEELMEHVIPLVEGRYRVRAGAAHRALAGPSMGAEQAVRIGLAHPERFSWLVAMAPGPLRPASELDPRVLNRKLRLFWIGCGRRDARLENLRRYEQALTGAGIRHVWHEGAGTHNWLEWREYLAEVLPLLFRG
jgi:enterochelin esterase-like enzyme